MTSISQTPNGALQQFLQHLGTSGMSLEDIQRVNREPKLAACMVASLRRSPQSPEPNINWSPLVDSPDSYFERIKRWNQLRCWNIDNRQLDELEVGLRNTLLGHNGLYPLSLDLWLGRDLAYNWNEAMACLREGVQTLGYEWREYFDASCLSFYDSYSPLKNKTAQLVKLDLAQYWDGENGLAPRQVHTQHTSWPGLVVAWLLALNPQVAVVMDGETIPYLLAPGLVVEDDRLPIFRCDAREVYVDEAWGVIGWCAASVVSFRK